MGAGSSAGDALREERPRHGLQDFPRVTRSLARGQKGDARRQREKRSGEPRHSLACAPRGSACAPHDASRRFWCVRGTTREPPLPCARVCRLSRPARARAARGTAKGRTTMTDNPLNHELLENARSSRSNTAVCCRDERFRVTRSRSREGLFFVCVSLQITRDGHPRRVTCSSCSPLAPLAVPRRASPAGRPRASRAR